MNYQNLKNRIGKLDGGNTNQNEPVIFFASVGAKLPPEYDPAVHSVIRDRSDNPRPAIGYTRNQLKEMMAQVNGKTRSL